MLENTPSWSAAAFGVVPLWFRVYPLRYSVAVRWVAVVSGAPPPLRFRVQGRFHTAHTQARRDGCGGGCGLGCQHLSDVVCPFTVLDAPPLRIVQGYTFAVNCTGVCGCGCLRGCGLVCLPLCGYRQGGFPPALFELIQNEQHKQRQRRAEES